MELSKFVMLAVNQVIKGVNYVNLGKDSIIAGSPTSIHFEVKFYFSDDGKKILVGDKGDSYMEFDVPIA